MASVNCLQWRELKIEGMTKFASCHRREKRGKRMSFTTYLRHLWLATFVHLLIVLSLHLALEKLEELMNQCAGLWLATLRTMTEDEFPWTPLLRFPAIGPCTYFHSDSSLGFWFLLGWLFSGLLFVLFLLMVFCHESLFVSSPKIPRGLRWPVARAKKERGNF